MGQIEISDPRNITGNITGGLSWPQLTSTKTIYHDKSRGGVIALALELRSGLPRPWAGLVATPVVVVVEHGDGGRWWWRLGTVRAA
jgi:hypothetical protein